MEKQPSLCSFSVTWFVGALVLIAAGFVLAQDRHIGISVSIPVIAAFVVEFAFYLVPGFPRVRNAIEQRVPKSALGPALACSAVLPYLVYSIPTGYFHPTPFFTLIGVAVVASFWFVLFPPSVAADFGFIAILAAVYLSKIFKQIYLSPVHKVAFDVLGHLMLIRLGATVMLLQRRFHGVGFGFVPSRREMLVGLRFFLYFLPVGLPLGWALGIVTFHGRPGSEWQALGIFFGIFWVVALSEEFLFRGILLQWVSRLTGERWMSLAIASVIFGLCHLWMRGFPNWRMALFATVAGAFWGEAYRAGHGIRASMVAHALVVTTWLKWLN